MPRMKKRVIEAEYSTPKGTAVLRDIGHHTYFQWGVRLFAFKKPPTYKTFSTYAEAIQWIKENLL